MNININSLCNAFLAKYNTFDPVINKSSPGFVNKSPAFYDGLRSFLAKSGIKVTLNTLNPSSSGYTTNVALDATNKFENELAVILQAPPNGTITATSYLKLVNDPSSLTADFFGYTSRIIYALVLKNGSINDTLFLSKRMGVTQSSCNPTGTAPSISMSGPVYANTFYFSNIRTVLDDSASVNMADGYIADNLVFANLNGLTNGTGQPGCDNYVIWGHKISMLNPKNSEALNDCINCVQIKNAVQDYYANASAEGLPTFTNDPYYTACLSNYLNYKLKQNHSYSDYENLMKGCALSDFSQFKFRQSPGQYHRSFGSLSALNDFVNAINERQ